MVEVADFNHRPKETPMTETDMPLIELLQKHDAGDFLRAVIEAVLQTLTEHQRESALWIRILTHANCCELTGRVTAEETWFVSATGARFPVSLANCLAPPEGPLRHRSRSCPLGARNRWLELDLRAGADRLSRTAGNRRHPPRSPGRLSQPQASTEDCAAI
jgi:hypothetical protein